MRDLDRFEEGQFAAGLEDVSRRLETHRRDNVVLVPGWFADTLSLPEAAEVREYSFVRIDCDLYALRSNACATSGPGSPTARSWCSTTGPSTSPRAKPAPSWNGGRRCRSWTSNSFASTAWGISICGCGAAVADAQINQIRGTAVTLAVKQSGYVTNEAVILSVA